MTDETTVDMNQLMQKLARDWWVLLIRGVLLVVLGLYALVMPGQTLATFCLIFGLFLIIDAVISIASGLGGGSGWAIGRGLLTLIIGVIIVAAPAVFGAVAAVVLVYFVAAGLVIAGVAEIAAVVQHKEHAGAWVFVQGVLSIAFGLLLALMPVVAAAALIMVAGIYAIVFGIALIALSFKVKGYTPQAKDGSTPEAG
ncbi:MAG: DUF308 domain-containing protein [Planctomycetota bacterium]